MYKVDVENEDLFNEKTYKVKLKSGLNLYVCYKKGFHKKIGMFGTKYGSLTNEFIDIKTGEKQVVPDGIAHFLEHKLFEKEGQNALDMFSKIGVDSNAYTSYDQTVFYFQTVDKFEESIKMLVKLIKEPYFTDENVEKEKGIIEQEIKMGLDDPNYILYYNTINQMYLNSNVKIDIAGSVESIQKINKELLYKCYDNFYNLNNMFFIVVGDVDVDKTIKLVDESINSYKNDISSKVVEKISKKEPDIINEKEKVSKMDIGISKLCIGFKLPPITGSKNLKRKVIVDFIYNLYFSEISDFFKNEYKKGIITSTIDLEYEGNSEFSHILLFAESDKIEILKDNIINEIKMIKDINIDEKLFDLVKKDEFGTSIIDSDAMSPSYSRIIDSAIENTNVYEALSLVKELKIEDIKEFMKYFDFEKMVISYVLSKE